MYLVSMDCTSYLLPPRECIGTLCIHVYVDLGRYAYVHLRYLYLIYLMLLS